MTNQESISVKITEAIAKLIDDNGEKKCKIVRAALVEYLEMIVE